MNRIPAFETAPLVGLDPGVRFGTPSSATAGSRHSARWFNEARPRPSRLLRAPATVRVADAADLTQRFAQSLLTPARA